MKAYLLLAIMGLSLGGCGGSGGDDDDDDNGSTGSIVGKWGVEVSTGCAIAFTADGENYEGDTICPLDGGSYGMEAQAGTYSIAGNELTLTPVLASCPTSDHSVETLLFQVQGSKLKFTTPSGVIVMERLPDDGGGSVVTAFGCLDVAAGQFTQHDIEPI